MPNHPLYINNAIVWLNDVEWCHNVTELKDWWGVSGAAFSFATDVDPLNFQDLSHAQESIVYTTLRKRIKTKKHIKSK